MFMARSQRREKGTVSRPLLITPLYKSGVWINQVLQRKATVGEGLHCRGPITVCVPLNPGGMIGHLIHHLPTGMGEIEAILEKIAMAVDVGHDQLLVNQIVAFEQVGIAGIIIDDHFVDF
jgi:hypothetical protein